MKEDAPRVIKIPAKPEATRQAEARRQLRVAAYCRVSTKEEDQANSYEVQKEYYTDKIMSNTAWTMAGIFADKGITGTSAKKREDFMRMIRHCRQKKIDVILTKSQGYSAPATKMEWVARHGKVSREAPSWGVLAKAMSTLPDCSRPRTLWLRPEMIWI